MISFKQELGILLKISVIRSERTTNSCIFEFTMTFLALVSMAQLVSLTVESTISISLPHPTSKWFTDKRKSLLFILLSWTYGFIWAFFPFLGWGSYAKSFQNDISCSVSLGEGSSSSYIYSLLMFCYLLPLLILIVCFIKIRFEIKTNLVWLAKRNITSLSAKHAKLEKKNSTVVLLMLLAFFIAWTPYAVIAFCSTYTKQALKVYLTEAMFLGKSSCMYNPIILFAACNRFRSELLSFIKHPLRMCCLPSFQQDGVESYDHVRENTLSLISELYDVTWYRESISEQHTGTTTSEI